MGLKWVWGTQEIPEGTVLADCLGPVLYDGGTCGWDSPAAVSRSGSRSGIRGDREYKSPIVLGELSRALRQAGVSQGCV